MKVNSGQAPSTLIPEYIGSAFDAVLTCADNIDDIKTVSENITDVVATGDNILDVNTVATNVEDVTLVADNIDYVKDVAEGIEGLPVSGYIGDTPPTQPKVGATWYCTLDGRNYTWYEDVDSGQWVESSPQSTADDPHLAGNIFTLWKRSAAEAGYNLVAGSFEEGGVLTSSTDVLWHKSLDSIYSWTGAYPAGGHVVAPSTDPVAVAGYVPRTDVGSNYDSVESMVLTAPAIENKIVRTGQTKWVIVSDPLFKPLSCGLFAKPLGSIYLEDYTNVDIGVNANDAFKYTTRVFAPRSGTISTTIKLKSNSTFFSEGCNLAVASTLTNLFEIRATTSEIAGISIIGGQFTEQSLAAEGNVTFISAVGDYGAGVDLHIYITRVNILGVKTHNFAQFMHSDWCRSWNVDNCFIYGRNGFDLLHKNVECTITNTIVFGTAASDPATFGLRIGHGLSHAGERRYPEGIKVSSCTMDNFGRTLSIHDVLDVNVTDTWIGSSTNPSAYSIVFEAGIDNKTNDIHINHCTIYSGKFEFIGHAAPPTASYIHIADCIYDLAQTIAIGAAWHDITIADLDVHRSATTLPYVGIVAQNDNQRCHFKDIVFKGAYSSLIQIKNEYSVGCSIDHCISEQFVDDPFYLQSPVKVTNSTAGKPVDGLSSNGGQKIYSGRLVSATVGNAMATIGPIRIAKGALVRVLVKGLMSSSVASGSIGITQSSPVLESMVSGTGWDAKFIEISTSKTSVGAELMFRSTSDDPVTLQLEPIDCDVTASYHSSISLWYM